MRDKVVSAAKAASWVSSGMHLGVGAGMAMNPMPVIREIIKNGVRDLRLTPVLTGGYVADLLIGAGCVSTVQFPMVVMDEFGLAPNFRRKAQAGELQLLETGCPAFLLALQAGAYGLPFTPVIGFLHTDYMKIRKDFKVIQDPYSGDDYVVVPPIVPDVAVIHAVKGDRFGNVIVDALRNDRLLAMASKKTIAVVEELVDPEEVLPGRNGVFVAHAHIDAVVVAPGGAHPTACSGKYGLDKPHLQAYMQAAKAQDTLDAYIDTYILGPADHAAYLGLVGHGGAL